eukprot:NODE_4533_length_651_cov_68.061462_g3879_i0.p1 GENE.NODE_4533_length_651_cov_68.061462_g3879_i0~~NODE_4533_length_651_cov_68.061462_g3879_i0.p1  ORF type:complete len:193 (-),score=42.55 NODE_4533_length_651_cov_68.061462_g3879_i0:73-630(-)
MGKFGGGPSFLTTTAGPLTACFNGSDMLASYFWGRVASTRFGWRGEFLAATTLQASALVFLLFWSVPSDPGPMTTLLLFTCSVVLGIGDAVWFSQVPAILQCLFPDGNDLSAAMSNLKLWQSLGFAVQFLLGLLVQSFEVKTAVVLSVLASAYLFVVVLDVGVMSLKETGVRKESMVEVNSPASM